MSISHLVVLDAIACCPQCICETISANLATHPTATNVVVLFWMSVAIWRELFHAATSNQSAALFKMFV
jgi:hypothetical protein